MNILQPDQAAYLESLKRKDKEPLYIKMEEFAKEKNIPILEDISAEFLEQLLYIYRPKSFLEIGTAIGYSTIRVAKLLKNETLIDTIEISKDNLVLCKSFIQEAGLENRINILEGDALKILPQLNKYYDFIFLDADKEDYLELLNHSLNILNVGGVILIDNLLWKGFTASKEIPDQYKKSTELIRKFNAQFLSHPKLKSSILPIGDGLGLGIKIS
jgi:caffeoyl-CoA O-methyltransferase